MTSFGAGGLLGGVVGGVLGQWLYNRQKRWVPILMGSTTMLGIAPCLYLINVEDAPSKLALISCVAFLAGAVSTVTGSNIRAIILNVNIPQASTRSI